ncbi:MAG TPA: [FeFe] hydrogenase H-cluster maturation GTPase HydF, partial [Verrucomicrobia bacterium]|nr:[FeFe] hydrogenase H-cluster maturation GTPase HydF [Verrucomicrobiota bacterium]
MDKTPKSMRLHIGLFGRTNVGKSTFLNLLAGQDVAIVSPLAGTTTDPVEKTMELPPIGPVVFTDTGGVDDKSFNATAWKGAQDAATQLDIEAKYLESKEIADFEKNINAFIAEKCDIII